MLHTTTGQGRKKQNHAAERDIGFLAKRRKLRTTQKESTQTFMGLRTRLRERVALPYYGTRLDRPTKPNFENHTRRAVSPLAWRFALSWIGPELLAHYQEQDYLQADERKEIEDFNRRLEDSLYLQDIDDDLNSEVRREE
jgi:hypothetical protein